MTYVVILTPSAQRDLAQTNPRIVPAILEFIYGDLAKSPQRVGKSLRNELAGTYSARCGPYRVLYTIEDEGVVVTIVRIDHRADAYKPR